MNVVVIACNGLHLGFLGPYGNAWIETPQIDRLAAEGVVFDHHYAENLTTIPTRRSWWTGRYGFHDSDLGWTPLRPDEAILPDLLSVAGVRTALVSDNPILRKAGEGFGRGFDDVAWVRGSGYDPFVTESDPRAQDVSIADEPGLRLPDEDDPDYPLWEERWSQLLRNRAVLKWDQDESNTGAARTVTEAVGWLDRHGSGDSPMPFLLWLDLFSPHGPWDPPQPYRDRYAAADPDEFELGEGGDLEDDEIDEEAGLEEVPVLIDVPPGAVGDVIDEAELLRLRRTYAGSVALLDAQIGRLYEALERLGRLDDTLIIFTADQGEPLGEHGYVRRFRPWLYEELVHTPLILRLPKGERGGTRHTALVQSVDLAPTALAALGLLASEDHQGQDLLPLARGDETKIRDYACLGMDSEEFAIRTQNWYLILPVQPDPEDPPRGPELYRKPEDRWDQLDVIEQFPEVADHLELALRRFVEALRLDEPLIDLPALRDVVRFQSQ